MKIEKPDLDISFQEKVCEDLKVLISQPTMLEEPPCPNCTKHDLSVCSSKCPDAPRALSIEPDRYPIEPKVTPLVFELKATRVMQTCWPCEGHMSPEGELWKVPQVSFYSPSAIYPKLLLNHINQLKMHKKIAYDWVVVLSDYGQTWGVTYTIEPKLDSAKPPRLGLLQNDLLVISDNLSNSIKNEARKLLMELTRQSVGSVA